MRSDNIATIQWDARLFRFQRPEVLFYEALNLSGVPFAPLSVVLEGGMPVRRRIEPGIVLYRQGLVMVLEIDGDLGHHERLREARDRLKSLTGEGVTLERIGAAECDTPGRAVVAVKRVLLTLEKHRQTR